MQINNKISFYGLRKEQSLENINRRNLHKLESVEALSKAFPAYDIMLGGERNGELSIKVKKSDMLDELCNFDMCTRLGMDPETIVDSVNLARYLKHANKVLYRKKDEEVKLTTKNLDSMSGQNVLDKICDAILEYRINFSKNEDYN